MNHLAIGGTPDDAREEKPSVRNAKSRQQIYGDCRRVWYIKEYHQTRADGLLEVCEEIANLLEGGQLTAMQIPPTARIEAWRKSEKKNIWEIKKFAYSLAKELKSSCQII